jgi:hypothetical protein
MKENKQMNTDTPETILLYRYLDASAALKTIESRAFKVGRLRDFNDPFEWRMGITNIIPEGEIVADACMESFIDEMQKTIGIICFSEAVTDPVLWSHYADNHQGVALEVDYILDPEKLIKMEYTDNRPVFDANRLHDNAGFAAYARPLMDRLYRQKSTGWAYEREHRVLIKLESCKIAGGFYFQPIPDHFLTRVILGYRCPLDEIYVRKALDATGLTDTKVIRAKLCAKTYAIRIG